MRFSVVIPVYNRPAEVRELLQSLTAQTIQDFEVLIVEDGSTARCDKVVDDFRDKLSIQYFFKQNEGPGPARNFGFTKASGLYFVVFDSDCILPPDYFEKVQSALDERHWDAWGGPDRASSSFTPLQQAIGFTMSSVLTTGGIRGGKKKVGWFQPRSFNMGFSREVFNATGGFHFSRYAEDIELSIRIKKAGFSIGLIEEAFVYHKRRTTLKQFYRQVYFFGKGRALVGKVHPKEVKITHWFPVAFIAGLIVIPFSYLLHTFLPVAALIFYALYFLAIFGSSLRYHRKVDVAFLSVATALVQLWGYGMGFIREQLKSDSRPE